MSVAALYTDLSRYYDLMCASIDYRAQSEHFRRLNQLFGNGGRRHLDLGCGTGPHVAHFVGFGFDCSGLDLHQPMLDIARQRCPQATFMRGDMRDFVVAEPFDLITSFLYSIHYCQTIQGLQRCVDAVYAALKTGGLFCFNAVDKTHIDNRDNVREEVVNAEGHFQFQSGWRYDGAGDEQSLLIRIERRIGEQSEVWQDRHPMVAVSFAQLQQMLSPRFEVHLFEHDYDRIEPWAGSSGNALFVCEKR
jgi:SAM-dependent methyltransferase